MTTFDIDTSTELEEAADPTRRTRSDRGPFEVFRAPALGTPVASEALSSDEIDAQADVFDYDNLVDDEHDAAQAREAVSNMLRAIAPGNLVTFLFQQDTPNGMSLVHAWFGPHFPLFRHSHPRFGDCLYYVVGGQVILGSQVLGPGDGFFVPNGMAYKYKAGPEGVEVLEFRAGGGDDNGAVIKLYEQVESVEAITAAATALRPQWSNPPTHVSELNERVR